MEEPNAEQLTRRLQKALRLVEKLKSKNHFEKEVLYPVLRYILHCIEPVQVSKELAKRNDTLQAELDKEREQYSALCTAFNDLYEEMNDSLKDLGTLSTIIINMLIFIFRSTFRR